MRGNVAPMTRVIATMSLSLDGIGAGDIPRLVAETRGPRMGALPGTKFGVPGPTWLIPVIVPLPSDGRQAGPRPVTSRRCW